MSNPMTSIPAPRTPNTKEAIQEKVFSKGETSFLKAKSAKARHEMSKKGKLLTTNPTSPMITSTENWMGNLIWSLFIDTPKFSAKKRF